jgi:hypothetical protein
MNRREFCHKFGLAALGLVVAPKGCFGDEPTVVPAVEPPRLPTAVPATPTNKAEVTPPVNQTDLDNQRTMEQAIPGEMLTLEDPNITSIWQIPWAAEGDEANVATVALLWGQEHPSAVITSAACLRDFYKDNDMLGNAVVAPPLTPFRVWQLTGDVRPKSLVVEISDYTNQANARSLGVAEPNGKMLTIGCEETSNLERFRQFLNGIDWSELPGEAGELTGKILGDFVRGLIEGLRNDN